MACMTHECTACGYAEFNNDARSPSTCPVCSGSMLHSWDEEFSYAEERDRERDEEDDEEAY